jgi:hypothetical protein
VADRWPSEQAQAQAEAEAEAESDSILARITRPIVGLASQLEVLIPSGGLVLRAGALAGVVLSAVGLAILSFLWLWLTVRVPDSQVENVWLQYG